MNLLIVNGYDKKGWSKLAKYKIQPICEFYRDQLKLINPKLKTSFIYPSIDLKRNMTIVIFFHLMELFGLVRV